MADLLFPEKKESQIQDETSSSKSTEEGTILPEKDRQQRPSPSISSSRGHSRGDSDSSGQLDELEYVSTPDIIGSTSPADGVIRDPLSLARTRTSIASAASRPPDFEVAFEPDDPDNPKNWPLWYRAWIIFAVSFSTWGKLFSPWV